MLLTSFNFYGSRRSLLFISKEKKFYVGRKELLDESRKCSVNYDLTKEIVGRLDTRQSSWVDKEASTCSNFPHKVSNNGAKIRQSREHATMSLQFNSKNTLKLIRNNKSDRTIWALSPDPCVRAQLLAFSHISPTKAFSVSAIIIEGDSSDFPFSAHIESLHANSS